VHRLHPQTLATLALVFNALVWGLSWWPFRLLDERGLHPLWASCLISAFCGLVVLTLGRGGLIPARSHRTGLIMLAAACGLTNAAFNWGITVGEVVRVVLLFYLMPVWSLLAARWLLDERIDLRGALQILLALGGAAMMLLKPGVADGSLGAAGGRPDELGNWLGSLGDWLGLCGGIAFAITNVLLRRHRDAPPSSRAMAMFAGGAIVPALIALQNLSPVAQWPSTPGNWIIPFAALALAFLAANLALQFGAARLPARLTALVMLSELVFAVGSAVWIGDETLSAGTLLGACLILAATLWGLREVRRSSDADDALETFEKNGVDP